jgi:hypothetical protein
MKRLKNIIMMTKNFKSTEYNVGKPIIQNNILTKHLGIFLVKIYYNASPINLI